MFERTCRKSGIPARIAPVPRKLSSSCGLACEFPCDKRADVEVIAEEKKINVAGYHDIEEEQ